MFDDSWFASNSEAFPGGAFVDEMFNHFMPDDKWSVLKSFLRSPAPLRAYFALAAREKRLPGINLLVRFLTSIDTNNENVLSAAWRGKVYG